MVSRPLPLNEPGAGEECGAAGHLAGRDRFIRVENWIIISYVMIFFDLIAVAKSKSLAINSGSTALRIFSGNDRRTNG